MYTITAFHGVTSGKRNLRGTRATFLQFTRFSKAASKCLINERFNYNCLSIVADEETDNRLLWIGDNTNMGILTLHGPNLFSQLYKNLCNVKLTNIKSVKYRLIMDSAVSTILLQ